MELWIRSQDKQILKQAYELDIYDIFEEGLGYFYFIEESGTTLGKYKTKERALEVLDEIQSIIIGKYMCDLSLEGAFSKFENEKDVEKLLKQMALYEMPKE